MTVPARGQRMFGLTVSKEVRDYFKLVAVLAIIAVGFYVAL